HMCQIFKTVERAPPFVGIICVNFTPNIICVKFLFVPRSPVSYASNFILSAICVNFKKPAWRVFQFGYY
ncbi:MAG TPA: hypothetical protein PLI57_12840, partial [Spirochaetota bacterium]|nr:hypothetical protein [Spirochaetota bacterium]